MQYRQKNFGFVYAILAAILFGSSMPFAKILLREIHPWLLAGLFYLGSSIGVLLLYLAQQLSSVAKIKDAPLTSVDSKWLVFAILFGGILAPILLMNGLLKVSASSASLLLNLEAVFTALIAWLVFKEHVDYKIGIGMFLTVLGSVFLSWSGSLSLGSYVGIILIAGSCLCWAIDNNLTRKISAANPLQISLLKCLIAGLTNSCLAAFYTNSFPPLKYVLIACFVGFIGYGLSLAFYVLGLRHVGAARTGAYFSLAPFIGAILAIILLKDPISLQFVVASLLMGIGIWIHITEYHAHEHLHEQSEHSHRHVHDEHHQHEHEQLPDNSKEEPHTHVHKHRPIRHSHPHYPDTHHIHIHK